MPFADEASLAIREAGGRFTDQRKLIVALLESAGEQLDAEQLYQRAHEHDRNISLATVYRTLNVLEAAGLVSDSYLSPAHDRKVYEIAASGERYHFTCRQCHRVVAFESPDVERLKATLEVSLNARVDRACICFEGLCNDCRKGGVKL
jgi:Fur family transcriptional regulator, ferric uptake regulator